MCIFYELMVISILRRFGRSERPHRDRLQELQYLAAHLHPDRPSGRPVPVQWRQTGVRGDIH